MGQAAQAGILYNPNSRHGSEWYRKQLPSLVSFNYLSKGTDSVADIPEVLAAFAKEGVTHLAVIGGDGTLDAVLTAMRNHKPFVTEPVIGLFNAGTTNMTFKDLGFKTYSRAPLARFVSGAQNGTLTTKAHQPLYVESTSLKKPLIGFFMGMAAVPRAIHQTRENYHKKGITNGISEGATVLSSIWRLIRNKDVEHDSLLKPVKNIITLDEGKHEAQTILLTVTSLEKLLVGLRPIKRNPAEVAIMGIFSPYSKLVRHLPALLFGTRRLPLTKNGNFTATTSTACELTFDGEWTLDGEMYQSTKEHPVRIRPAESFTFAVGTG